MSSNKQKSIHAMLLEIAKPNRCVSKLGAGYSQQFATLKTKPAGDTSVLNVHESTKRKHMESNQLKEKILQDEGRLKVIKSDLKRSTLDRNSVKDPATMDTHLDSLKRRVKREHSTLLEAPEKRSVDIKLERIIPISAEIPAFRSPSRTQLQDYESKEDVAKPNAVAYRPNYGYVLKQDARPASLPQIQENPGKVKKRELFQKKMLTICNRLADKIDRGHEISEMREQYASSVGSASQLLVGPKLVRRGSNEYFSNSLGRISSLGQSPRLPRKSTMDISHKKVNLNLQTKTAQVTGRKDQKLIKEILPKETHIDNFSFKRDAHDERFKTGNGPINVNVSRVNSISTNHDYTEIVRNKDEALIIGKQSSAGPTRSDRAKITTDFAPKEIEEYTNIETNNLQKQVKRGPNKSIKKGSTGLITMSKVDSTLSIQNQQDIIGNSRSISSLHEQYSSQNRSLPTKNPAQIRKSSNLTSISKGKTFQGGLKSEASLLSLSDVKVQQSEFKYDVTFATKKYHLVRNRNIYGNEDSIQLMQNEVGSPTKLPSVKMHLQTNRPPNMAQLHDARFEEIDKEPKILSSVKKVQQIDFNKQNRKKRHECLINAAGDLSMQKYNVKESVIKKNTAVGAVRIDKQYDWSQLIQKGDQMHQPSILSHDPLRAANQLLRHKRSTKSIKGSFIGYEKQAPREFLQFEVAQLSEKMERLAELHQDEQHMKRQRQIKQKAIMNIHSRLGTHGQKRTESVQLPNLTELNDVDDHSVEDVDGAQ